MERSVLEENYFYNYVLVFTFVGKVLLTPGDFKEYVLKREVWKKIHFPECTVMTSDFYSLHDVLFSNINSVYIYCMYYSNKFSMSGETKWRGH